MKFCKCINCFVVIFITDFVSSSSDCCRCLYSTDNVFNRDIAAITSLWPVEYFLWSMGVHELDIYVTLLLINFVHQTDPPQRILHARNIRWHTKYKKKCILSLNLIYGRARFNLVSSLSKDLVFERFWIWLAGKILFSYFC